MRTRHQAAEHPADVNSTLFDREAAVEAALIPHGKSASEEGYEDEDSQVRSSEGEYASFAHCLF